jgi:hypothetical protein
VVDCWCQIPCEKIDDCDLLDDYEFKDVEDCVGDCIIWGPDVVFCVLHNACDDIIAECVD